MVFRLFIIFLFISFSAAAQQKNELYRFTREKKAPDGQVYLYTGMQDSAGREVIPALFDHIWDFNGDTITLARKIQWDPFAGTMVFAYQMITRNGFLYFDFPDHYEPMSKNGGTILCLNRRNMLYGYLDLNGNTLIKFRYSMAGEFKEGLAFAENPGTLKKGFINTSGKWVIQPDFDEAYGFSEGLAVVKKNGKWFYTDKTGLLTPIPGNYSEIYELKEGFSVVSIQQNDSVYYGFIDRNAREIVAPGYEFLDRFEQRTAVFQKKGRTGMLDTSGTVVVPALYDELYRYDQRHYLFQLNGLQGLMRLDGQTILPAKYSTIGYFREGLCPVSRSGKWGFADTSGKEVIPCRFAEIRDGFNGGRATVRLGDQWWIAFGKDTLSLPDYDEVLPFFGQVAPFRYKQNWGFLNVHGEECLEPRFDELIFNQNGLIYARVTAKDSTQSWSVISNSGKLISEELYQDIVRSSEGISAVKTNQGWGFINASGIQVCSPHYQAVRNFSEGRAAVMLNNEWGFISEHGNEVIPVFTRMPNLEDSTIRTLGDTLRLVREIFPLFKREPLGDFKDNCACIADLSQNKPEYICINRIGKTEESTGCEPFIKMADQLTGSEFENKAFQVIRLQGSWIEIDVSGEKIN